MGTKVITEAVSSLTYFIKKKKEKRKSFSCLGFSETESSTCDVLSQGHQIFLNSLSYDIQGTRNGIWEPLTANDTDLNL